MKNRRKGFKVGAFAFCVLLIISFAFKSPETPDGAALYKKNCARCHGDDGTRGKFRAKNLQTSKMPDGEILALIKSGKKMMPSFNKTLSDAEIKSVIAYTKKLRK